jgi:hypothetical protein
VVDKCDISVIVGIDTYINTAREIEKELVGFNTTNYIKITGYLNHFIDRVIGQTFASSKQ